jgi:hypothetical protein
MSSKNIALRFSAAEKVAASSPENKMAFYIKGKLRIFLIPL